MVLVGGYCIVAGKIIIKRMNPIYLDYASTTPIDTRVLRKMFCYMQDCFGNSASLHQYGREAKAAIELARAQVAGAIGCEPEEIIWTSGATEANNLAIKGAAQLYSRRGKHIVTVKTEHKAVLDPCFHLEKNGYELTYLNPKPNGLIDLDELQAKIRPDTMLLSVMWVNNEIGVVQQIEKIAQITASRGILLHVDAAQAVGKINIALNEIPIDLLSLSAHKVYGPKGIGALYLRKRPRVRVEPLIHGGGHELGMRSGTLPTHQIVGMGEAFHLAKQEFESNIQHISQCRQTFLTDLKSISCLMNTVPLECTVPHIVNVLFKNMIADAILNALPNVATSTASACQGHSLSGSYVLRALGLTEAEARSAVRFSFGNMTTIPEINQVTQAIKQLFTKIN